MKKITTTNTARFIITACLIAGGMLLNLASPAEEATTTTSSQPTLTAEARAAQIEATRKRVEETVRYLEELLKQVQANITDLMAERPLKQPYDPEAVKAAEEARKWSKHRVLAPWLFTSDGKPTTEGEAFFDNKPGP